MDRLISEQELLKHFDPREDWAVVQTIKAIPSAEPQTGHWITKIKSDLRGDMRPTNPKCSECGGEPYYSNTIYNYKFCPYCGVKMVETKMSENPTSSKPEISSYYGLKSYVRERSDKE